MLDNSHLSFFFFMGKIAFFVRYVMLAFKRLLLKMPAQKTDQNKKACALFAKRGIHFRSLDTC